MGPTSRSTVGELFEPVGFDRAAFTGQSPTPTTTMTTEISLDRVPDRLPIGIDVLDDRLNGGVRAGSIVLVSAHPISQSEVLLAKLTAPRPTLYITTQRSAQAVRRSLALSGVDVDRCSVVSIDDADPMPINQAYEHVDSIRDGSTLIIDAVNPFEGVDPPRLWKFLNGVQARLDQTNSVGFLHALAGRNVPDNRDLTAYLSDVVFELETDIRGEYIENRLYVPKVRGGEPIEEVVKMGLTDGVTIDTSRDIT